LRSFAETFLSPLAFLPPMIRLTAALLALATLARAEDPVQPPRDPAYKLVWADEFDGDGPVDESKWRFEHGFERNHELQWYQKDNALRKGGLLVIEARREKVPNPRFEEGSRDWKRNRREADYTSASITTMGKHDWKFGRFEVRARFTPLPGLWPAIWTTGRGRWPDGGEIDILEYYSGRIYANFCWAGKRGRDVWNTGSHSIGRFVRDDSWKNDFHHWVLEWDEEKMTVWLDGEMLNTQLMKHVENQDGPVVNPFLAPHAFRLNLAIGGPQGGDPSGTSFPQKYEVDYVRIYQK
jgi:beta-glucanase (GH16 family)